MRLLARVFPPSLDPHAAAGAIEAKERAVIDVREASEYAAGRIAGSRNVPLKSLQSGSLDSEQRYIAVCHTGARSSLAARRLRKAGLDVVNLRGGMVAWERAGLPVVAKQRRGR